MNGPASIQVAPALVLYSITPPSKVDSSSNRCSKRNRPPAGIVTELVIDSLTSVVPIESEPNAARPALAASVTSLHCVEVFDVELQGTIGPSKPSKNTGADATEPTGQRGAACVAPAQFHGFVISTAAMALFTCVQSETVMPKLPSRSAHEKLRAAAFSRKPEPAVR